ncbi:protein of unknown function [Pararobbsia alpina]
MTLRELARTIRCRQCEFKTIGDLLQAVLDGDACHGGVFLPYMLRILHEAPKRPWDANRLHNAFRWGFCNTRARLPGDALSAYPRAPFEMPYACGK